jgi:alkylation response protein AidB-like acyl-CoA dehydrogenase
MRFLERERHTVAKLLPGLDEFLAGIPLAELERPGNPGIAEFRRSGGAGLLVPEQHGGAGAGALEALRVQRAIGARSPSLAVATTMHHFSMASLVVLAETGGGTGLEWMLMEGLAKAKKLLASGFAEGRPGSSILEPTMSAVAAEGGVRVTGVKRPCSLAASMDLLTASVSVPRLDGTGEQLAVVLIPADAPGLRVSPFWGTFALAGTESEQVNVNNVFVPEELVVRTEPVAGGLLDELQVAGFLWFELLMCGSYLGAASAVVERVLGDERVPAAERVRLVTDLEAAMAALENIARRMPVEQRDQQLLGDALLVRYAVQDAIARVLPRALELLGGMAFIGSSDLGYLAATVNALGFHPPSRTRMAEPLAAFLSGESLAIA